MAEWITSSEPYLAPGDPAAADPWREEAAREGRVGAHKVILVARRVPDERVARLLHLAKDAPAVLRRRLVTLDEVPVEISDSWYPPHVADGTALAEDRPIKGGAARALAERGFIAERHIEEVAVVDVPAELGELLPRSPVLELTRTSYAAGDVPFEVGVMLMARDMAPGVPRRLRYLIRAAPSAS
jgi:DNA-binding GntR family transcriptional regulator